MMMMATFSVKLAGKNRAQLLIDRGTGEEHLRTVDLTPQEYQDLQIALKNDSGEIDLFIFRHIRESDFVSGDYTM